MPDKETLPKPRRNAENTRQVILNAAERVFSEHGFDGARVDVIAKESGYNQGLIFRYFGDKQGLYAEVLKRIDRQAVELLGSLIQPLVEDQAMTTDSKRFRAFLTRAITAFFDFLSGNPNLARMILWENAEGWRTYSKMSSIFQLSDLGALETLFAKPQQARLLRSHTDPFLLFLLAEQICWTYATSLPFYEMVLPGKDFSSAEARSRARQQIIEFIVGGLVFDTNDESTF